MTFLIKLKLPITIFLFTLSFSTLAFAALDPEMDLQAVLSGPEIKATPVCSNPIPAQPPVWYAFRTITIGCTFTATGTGVQINGDEVYYRFDQDGNGVYNEAIIKDTGNSTGSTITPTAQVTFNTDGAALSFEWGCQTTEFIPKYGYSGELCQLGIQDDWTVAIDSQVPGSPAWVYDDNPDVDWHPNGSLTIYWAPVTPGLSGLTYTLQRQVNSGGYFNVATGITGTSYPVSGTYNDGDFVQYRVRTDSGAGLHGNWAYSDGFTIDSQLPDTPGYVIEENPDLDWDLEGTVTVYWEAVDDTGSGIFYTIEKQINSGGFTTLATGLTVLFYADAGGLYDDGDFIEYRVRAVAGSGAQGNWAYSDGFTIDSEIPGTPASITEGSPDIDWSASGNITVYWSAVNDTGSGITYSLQKQINGGSFVGVAAGIVNNQYTDNGLYNDSDLIKYRVRAVNGVGSRGDWATSDGVTLDYDVPGAPTYTWDGSPDIDWDVDGNITVYWDLVKDTGSGITYTIQKHINTGSYSTIATGLTDLFYADLGTYNDGDFVQYRVRAVNGVGTAGNWTESDGFTLDFSTPGSPAPVTDGQPDVDADADGNITIYWATVANTGSGIKYNLQKQINSGSWIEVISNYNLTNYADSGSYNDDDFIKYRSQAVNGAGTSGPWAASDGFLIDSETPQTPAWISENLPDIDQSPDGNVIVYWGGVADTGSGITYTLQKSINNGFWNLVISDWTETFVADWGNYSCGDLVKYRVQAENGANLESNWATSDGMVIGGVPLSDQEVLLLIILLTIISVTMLRAFQKQN